MRRAQWPETFAHTTPKESRAQPGSPLPYSSVSVPKVRIHSVGHANGGVAAELVGDHEAVVALVGEEAHLQVGGGNLAPVEARHGVALEHGTLGHTRDRAVGINDGVGQAVALLVECGTGGVGIGGLLAHDQSTLGALLAEAVGVDVDHDDLLVLLAVCVGDLGALNVATIHLLGLADHDDVVAALDQLVAQVEGDRQIQFALQLAGELAGRAEGHLGFQTARVGAVRLFVGIGLDLVARVNDHADVGVGAVGGRLVENVGALVGLRLVKGLRLGLRFGFGLGLRNRLGFGLRYRLGFGFGYGCRLGFGFGFGDGSGRGGLCGGLWRLILRIASDD